MEILVSGPVFVGWPSVSWFLLSTLDLRIVCWLHVVCRKCYDSFARYGHWGSQVECVSRYWGLTRRNRDGLEGEMRKSTERRQAGSTIWFDRIPREWR